MQCNKCGSTIKDGLKYCTKCGANLVLTQSTDISGISENRNCPKCGELVENGNFCTNCGTKLSDYVNAEPENKGKKKKAPNKKKLLPVLIACLVLGVGGYFGVNYFINGFSDDLETARTAEVTGSIVIDASTITETVTDEESAYNVLNSINKTFGYENAKDVLGVSKIESIDEDVYYKFQQYYNDIPVDGKSIVVSADENGKVFNVSGNYLHIYDEIDTSPKINADKAKKKIEKQVKSELKKNIIVSEPQLVVYFVDGNPVLTWKSSVGGYTSNDEIRGYDIFIDADKGHIHSKETSIKYNSVSKTYYGKAISVTEESDSYLMKNENKKLIGNDAINKRYWLWKQYEDHECIKWDFSDEPEKDAVYVHSNLEKAYDFYNSLSRLGCDGHGKQNIETVINVEFFGEDYYSNNGFYTYQDDTNYIVVGEQKNLDSRLDFIAHEFTHGVNKHTAGFKYQGQSGALDEAYADIMGEMAELHANGSNDWIHNSNRNLINPKESNNPAHFNDYLTEAELKNGDDEVHYNSTIISHAAYLMWNGADGEGSAINDANTFSRLWYDSLYMLNADSNFEHCRTAVELSAQRLFDRGILTEEQVSGVSAAFEQVGIEKNPTYEIVSVNPELKVYAANNSEYYNYHYKVEKISIKNLYSVGKAVDTDISVIKEDDITEEKTVTLTDLSEDSTNKCAYRITISDLNDEPGETQTKIVAVSNAQDAKGVLDFRTDYIPPVGEVLEKINTALDGIKSLHLSQSTSSNYSVMGSSVNMSVGLESDINITNGIMRCDMSTKYGGRTINNQIYIKTNGNTSDIYMHTSGTWVKQVGVNINDLYKLGSGFEGLDGIKFYLNSMENAYIESDSDEKNHIISGEIGSADTEEALKKSGLSALIDQLDDSDEISDADIQSMFNNLSPMKFVFYIDKTTMLPSKMIIDMKDTTDSIYRNIKAIAAKAGENLTYSISENSATTYFSKYNGLSEIFIPEEAANGMDYKIVR